MVFCDTATAFIGIRILLSDLLSQMNETNMELIINMLCKGCIEDDNNYYNEVFKNIVGLEYGENDLPEEYLKCKEYLISMFKNNGSLSKNKFTHEVKPYMGDGCLFEKQLLVPIKSILSTDRWGYNREGINSSSRPLDFDLSVSTEEYKELHSFHTIFFIKQNAG